MQYLPLDVKHTIASFDEDAWYWMFRCDEEFAKSTMNEGMRKRFVNLFTVIFGEIDGYKVDKYGDIINSDDECSLGEDIINSSKINLEYRLLGKLHREDDLPAQIEDGTHMNWYIGGKKHRENDKPAYTFGTRQVWYYNDMTHRENDLPAIVDKDEMKWFYNGKIYRKDDKPTTVWPDGTQLWEIEYEEYHRENGLPAVIHPNGKREWWYNGKYLRKEKY